MLRPSGQGLTAACLVTPVPSAVVHACTTQGYCIFDGTCYRLACRKLIEKKVASCQRSTDRQCRSRCGFRRHELSKLQASTTSQVRSANSGLLPDGKNITFSLRCRSSCQRFVPMEFSVPTNNNHFLLNACLPRFRRPSCQDMVLVIALTTNNRRLCLCTTSLVPHASRLPTAGDSGKDNHS